MSLPQIITIVSTSLITIIVVVVGIQIILLLKEIRGSLSRLNQVMDTADSAFQRLSQPAVAIAGLLEGLKHSNKLFKLVSDFLDHNSTPPDPLISEKYEPLEQD